MDDTTGKSRRSSADKLTEEVGGKEARKIRARRKKTGHEIWFGLGMFGIIGWSVAIPTVAGIVAGIWIDSRWPSRFSWTLMLLFFGVIVGCLNAWYWVSRERDEIEREIRDEEP